MHHVVGLLLVARFEAWDHGEFGIETRVLFVLGRVHGWVIGSKDYESAVHACDSGIHKGIGAYVHTHVLHTHEGALTHIRHTKGRLHSCLLVGCPLAEDGLRVES